MNLMDYRRIHFPLNLQQFAEDGAGGDGGAGNDNPAENPGTEGTEGNKDQNDLAAQLEKAKADYAAMKAAFDRASHESSERKKQLDQANKDLKARMTAEEIAAQEKKDADEKQAARLAELEKEVAKARSSKSVMAKLGVDEDTAGQIAESLAGCENIENALLLIQKAWTAKEKALRLEFGKIPGPGAGGSSEEDAEANAAIELAKKLGREKADASASVAKGLQGYLR